MPSADAGVTLPEASASILLCHVRSGTSIETTPRVECGELCCSGVAASVSLVTRGDCVRSV